MTKTEMAAQILQSLITRNGFPRSEFEEKSYVSRAWNLAELFLAGPEKKEEVKDDLPSAVLHTRKPESGDSSGTAPLYLLSGEPLEP